MSIPARNGRLPNDFLKNDAGRDLRSLRRNLVEEATAIVIVIEIAVADLGIDAPGNLTAERAVGLHRDIRTGAKTADVHLASQIKSFESFAQIVAAREPDVRIGPIFGETETAIEISLQGPGDFLLRCYRVLPGLSDESE